MILSPLIDNALSILLLCSFSIVKWQDYKIRLLTFLTAVTRMKIKRRRETNVY